MAARPPAPGTVLTIPLADGRYGVGRLLVHPLVEFYATAVDDPADVDPDQVATTPVAFRIWVMDRAVRGRSWKKVGSVPLSAEEKTRQEVFFKQDAISKKLTTYSTDPVTEEQHEEPTSLERARQLEAAAVWSGDHVQDRLLDHLEGRENKWEKSLRPKG